MDTFNVLTYQLKNDEEDTFESELLTIIDDEYDMYTESEDMTIEDVEEIRNKAKKIKRKLIIAISIVGVIILLIKRHEKRNKQTEAELNRLRTELIELDKDFGDLIKSKPEITYTSKKISKDEEKVQAVKSVSGWYRSYCQTYEKLFNQAAILTEQVNKYGSKFNDASIASKLKNIKIERDHNKSATLQFTKNKYKEDLDTKYTHGGEMIDKALKHARYKKDK